jgi:hypothetical protein
VAQGTDAELAAGIREAKEQLAPVPTDDTPAMEGEAQTDAVQEIIQVFEDDLEQIQGYEVDYDTLGMKSDMSWGHQSLKAQFVYLRVEADFYTRKINFYGTADQIQNLFDNIPQTAKVTRIQ